MSGQPQLRIFLSASVPLPSRNPIYFSTADVVAIRDAIRVLTMVVIEERAQIVFGGHPAITPMIRLQIAESRIPVGNHVVMFQSRFFEHVFPQDNAAFEHVKLIDAVPDDRDASLLKMREIMLAEMVAAGFFIGGMEGVEEEYNLFRQIKPGMPVYPIASTGAEAAKLFSSDPDLQRGLPQLRDEISYLSLMRDLVSRVHANGSPPSTPQG